MRTLEVNVFNSEDLQESGDLFRRAYRVYLSNFDASHVLEYYNNTETFFKLNYNGLIDRDVLDLRGLRLRTWLINNFLVTIEDYKSYYAARVDGGLIHNCVGEDTISRKSNVQVEISCPFTGCYTDHYIIDSIMEFINNPNDCDDANDLRDAAIEALCRAYDDEIEHMQSEEYFLKEAKELGTEFYGSGDVV